jgi:hypothetical protein
MSLGRWDGHEVKPMDSSCSRRGLPSSWQSPDQASSTRQIRSVVDIYRPANLLMQPHGADNAKLFAAERADRLLAQADLESIAAPGGGFAGT